MKWKCTGSELSAQKYKTDLLSPALKAFLLLKLTEKKGLEVLVSIIHCCVFCGTCFVLFSVVFEKKDNKKPSRKEKKNPFH